MLETIHNSVDGKAWVVYHRPTDPVSGSTRCQRRATVVLQKIHARGIWSWTVTEAMWKGCDRPSAAMSGGIRATDQRRRLTAFLGRQRGPGPPERNSLQVVRGTAGLRERFGCARQRKPYASTS